jgi:ribosomal protein S18 acetylase RimI-like enzyme
MSGDSTLAHRTSLYPPRQAVMSEPGAPLVVRTALVSDAPSIAAIGRVAFPAVHNAIVGAEFAAAVVEQTYSVVALTDCITHCANADDAEFLVAERDGEVIGYLHYDSEGVEPELHRIYVDPGQKRGGVGSALMRELHARLPPPGQYILLVAELNKDAQAFYERHGLVIESRVDGPSHYINTMAIETGEPPPQAAAVLMRYTASSS